MSLVLSLVAILSLLALTRVCKRQKLSTPPLRMPLIAAVAIPILTLIAGSLGVGGQLVLQKSLAATITLLWSVSLIRLLSWGLLQIPSELGWWKPTAKILRDLLTLAIITTLALVVIHRDFRVNLVGLAATSAVVTAVIGLAAQETLKNLFAGISLQVDSPFEEGDWIDLGFTRGVVTSLRLMTTRIRGLDGSITVVPNSRITIEGLRRFKPDEPVGQMIDLGLDYSLPPRQAIQLLQRTLSQNQKVLRRPLPQVWVEAFNDSSITYRLLSWQASAPEMPQLKSDVLEQVWYALHRIDQSIPTQFATSALNRRPHACPPTASLRHRKKAARLDRNLRPSRDQQLETLAGHGSCQSFAPGETVVRQGDRGDSLFLVVSGSLDVFQASGTHPASSLPGQQVASLHSSDVFGEMALCTGEKRSASVLCNNECVLIEIERKHLLPLLEEHPEILETMGTIVSARRKELKALKGNRAESRRLALIARMQRLFNPPGQDE